MDVRSTHNLKHLLHYTMPEMDIQEMQEMDIGPIRVRRLRKMFHNP